MSLNSIFLLRALLVIVLQQSSLIAFAQASAPPLRCEIKLSAWCIVEGAQEIVRQLATDSVHDRVWRLRGAFRPQSQLVVLEPNGCRSTTSDTLEFVAFDENVNWNSKKWDRLRVRLDTKGHCDLDILLTPDHDDSLEWAYSGGLKLLRHCTSEACEDSTIAELKPKFESRFRRRR